MDIERPVALYHMRRTVVERAIKGAVCSVPRLDLFEVDGERRYEIEQTRLTQLTGTRRLTMTHGDVQTWLDAYVEAWRTYDHASIATLFTEDATYAYHPWDEGEEVVRGRDAIVANWLEEQDQPGSWEAQYRPLLVEGERAVATGTTSYASGDTYWNLWVLRFDEDGRCAEYVEWYMVPPSAETP